MTTDVIGEVRAQRPWLSQHAPVFVGVDAGPSSRHALAWAVAEARGRASALTIVHTWNWKQLVPWPTDTDEDIEDLLSAQGRELLDRSTAAAAGLPDVRTELRHGEGAEVLCELAGSDGLIVVGTRHLSGVTRLVMGSTSTWTVTTARCPVVVVGEPPADGTTPHEVVVGLSGTEQDNDVLAFAFDHARRHQLDVRALLAYPRIPSDLAFPPHGHWEHLAYTEIARWRSAYPDVTARADARPAHAVDLLVQASAGQALLVVGRRTPYPRMRGLLGSVCLGVLHHAQCPVAVVPEPPTA